MEAISERTPRPLRWAVLQQSWLDLAFLHWEVDPERVARLLPAGTWPDLFEGRAYAGLVPFRVGRTGPGFGVPYFGAFAETNVRLYTVDDEGRRGVTFRSMEASRLLPVVIARMSLRLPYVWASMRLHRDRDIVRYSSQRRIGGVRSEAAVRVGERTERPSELEHFLTARWGMHVPWFGRTIYVPNEHPPWPLHRAELLRCDDELLSAAGFEVRGEPSSVLFSPGVAVRFGLV